jgi:CRP-like cAMP-binding protein
LTIDPTHQVSDSLAHAHHPDRRGHLPEKRKTLSPKESSVVDGVRARFSEETFKTWQDTAICKALGESAAKLLDDAVEVVAVAHEVIYDIEHGEMPPLMIVVTGLVRVFTTSAQGRQATIRYAGEGDVIGLPALLAPTIVAPGSAVAVQSLVPSRILRISGRNFKQVVASDAAHMWPMYQELARSLMDNLYLLSENVFQPVRARVALHMLDLAQRQGDELVVASSQQDIADAIGSVREVVSRVVVNLRDEGILTRFKNYYVILDANRLQEIGSE